MGDEGFDGGFSEVGKGSVFFGGDGLEFFAQEQIHTDAEVGVGFHGPYFTHIYAHTQLNFSGKMRMCYIFLREKNSRRQANGFACAS